MAGCYHPDAELIARAFHEAYEGLAPFHGYETREASRKPWEEVPENNRSLMIATVSQLLRDGVIRYTPPRRQSEMRQAVPFPASENVDTGDLL